MTNIELIGSVCLVTGIIIAIVFVPIIGTSVWFGIAGDD
jgi:hypothetical protein